MPASEFSIAALPEWYRTERETAKIIEKLYNFKELDFYLGNPDEFIRRLAILRLNSLNEKDSLNILSELLENSLETERNKFLAAWILKSMSKRQGSSVFIRSKLPGNFSGFESFDDLFPVKCDNLAPSLDFDFSGSEIYNSLKLDNNDYALERDVLFKTEFNFKEWLKKFLSSILKKTLKTLMAIPSLIIGIPSYIGSSLKYLIINIFKYTIRKGKKKASGSISASEIIIGNEAAQKNEKYLANNFSETKRGNRRENIKQSNTFCNLYNLRYELNKKPGVLAFIKKGVFQLLYYLFFPVRFARRHKLIIICMFLSMYMLLAYTEYGRAFTNKYMNMDLQKVQTIAFEKIRGFSYYASNELNRITGIDEWEMRENGDGGFKTSNVSNDWTSVKKYFTVIAKKGLNIRKSPDLASDKVGSTSLPFGSTVAYLSKVQKDKSGVTWFYVKTQDGRTGWVSSKFLKEKTES